MSDTDLTNSAKVEDILKEFLNSANAFAASSHNETANQLLDEKYVLANIKLVLDNCVKRGSHSKSDTSMKILDILVKNYSNIHFAMKVSEFIATILDKV
jgi:transglutaminase/protease-like cytokinesis protein 3